MDKKDLRIMEILAQNCRISNTTIGEAVKLSKDAVIHRIKKLEKEDYLTQYIMFIDSRRLGYTRYQILIQFNASLDNKEEIYKRLKKLPFVLWMNTFIGKYDLQIIVDAHDGFHLKKIFDEIFKLCDYKVKEHTILTIISEIEFTHLNPDIDIKTPFKKKNDYSFSSLISAKNFAVGPDFSQYRFSALDCELLKLLADNPKITLANMVDKLKVDRKTIKRRIIHLIENKVIMNFGAINNTTKFGYVTYAIYAKILPETPTKLLKKSFEKLNNIFFAAKTMGDYNFIFYLNAKTPQELNKTMELFRNILGKYITYSDLFIQNKVLFWRQYTDGIYNDLKRRLRIYKNQFSY